MVPVDRVIREEHSIQVNSIEGPNEALLIEDLGGVMLLSLAAHRAPRGLENAPEQAATAFDRDVIKYDIAPWIREHANTDHALDGQDLSDETFRMIDLIDAYQAGKQQVAELEDTQKKLTTPKGTLSEKAKVVSDFMARAIEEHGRDAIGADPKLRESILRDADQLQNATGAQVQERIEELNAQIEQLANELEATTGAELTRLKETGTEAVKKLIAPIRALVRLELIAPGGNFEGLLQQAVTFGKYGANAKKLAFYVPNNMNATSIPATYAEALAFADAAYTEASKSTSIWT